MHTYISNLWKHVNLKSVFTIRMYLCVLKTRHNNSSQDLGFRPLIILFIYLFIVKNTNVNDGNYPFIA